MDTCNICSDPLEHNVIELKCKHKFHFNCIQLSYKYSGNFCPYCRQAGGKIINPVNICSAILKSGKNKGCKCSFKIKNDSQYCGKHQNYNLN